MESAHIDADTPQRLLITVHGIRTLGAWQEELSEKIRVEFGTEIEVRHFRYGYFAIFPFLIPLLRQKAARKFHLELLDQLKRNWKRIDIVAHSFGTYLVGWSLLRLPKETPQTIP